METFFKPVHSSSALDEIKPCERHHRHHQNPQSHGYRMFDGTDRNTDESHGHHCHHQHEHYTGDSSQHPPYGSHPRQTQQFYRSEEDEILYSNHTPVTIPRGSSSSLSSSPFSSPSSSSWYTEASANDPFSLSHAEQPQHSLSCSNIPDMHRSFQEDNSSERIVFATIKHGKKGNICGETHESSQHRGKHGFPSLDQGLSMREEGPLQGNESDLGGEQFRVPHMTYGPLYKTASLNHSLAFSEEDILLGVCSGPKRAVSSSQLPSKGILKNKKPLTDLRKTQSMEVLSPRVSKGQGTSGQKGKGITQAELEQTRANFMQGKLQFSAFLDEITKQVLSPSDLTSFGVNNNRTIRKTPAPVLQTTGLVKPQLPLKKHRERSREASEQNPKQPRRQEKAAHSSSRKQSDCFSPGKLISYATRNHHGSPPPLHYPHSASHSSHHGSSHKNRKLLSTADPVSGKRCGRCGPHLTDDTSTSPELSQPKESHHHKQQPTASYSLLTQYFPQWAHPDSGHRGPASYTPSSAQGAGPGLGSESSSIISDSSRARDTTSTATSHSSEQSGRHHPEHSGLPKQRRDTMCDADQLQSLQEENADLHQNLLHTVICIESLEVELQRTRDELSHVKEKYKSLLETHTGTKQANNLLGEHLHIASKSMDSERKYLQSRVLQLSSALEDAHRTMAALENINVSCLIKELLEKDFDSAEAMQRFLSTPAAISHSVASLQAHSQSPKVEEAAHDWLTKSEAGLQRVTAFVPFKQGVPTTGTTACHSGEFESCHSPPFSVADIGTAIYKKMASSYPDRPQTLYPQRQQQPVLGSMHTDTSPKPQQPHVGGDSWGGEAGVNVMLLEQNVVDVTSMSAQQILDDFLQQLQAHKEPGGGKEQQDDQEWVGGVEQTGKAADGKYHPTA